MGAVTFFQYLLDNLILQAQLGVALFEAAVFVLQVLNEL
jgi:hypothetical protein